MSRRKGSALGWVFLPKNRINYPFDSILLLVDIAIDYYDGA